MKKRKGKERYKDEIGKTYLHNPSFVSFVPVDNKSVEHDLAAREQDGGCASEVRARSATVLNLKLDSLAELQNIKMKVSKRKKEKKRKKEITHYWVPVGMKHEQDGGQFGDGRVLTPVEHLFTELDDGVDILDDADAGDGNGVVKGLGKGIGFANLQGTGGFVDQDLV